MRHVGAERDLKVAMGKVGVLVNPVAGDPCRGERLARHARAALGGDDRVVVTQSAEEIPDALHRLRDAGVSLLCVCGGDGTLHLTVQALFGVMRGWPPPLIVPLPAGTMNNVATSVALSGSPEEIIERVVACDEGEVERRAVEVFTLRVNDKYGFIFGKGFFVRLLQEYYEGGGRGQRKALQVFLKASFSAMVRDQLYREAFKWAHDELIVDGEPFGWEAQNGILCSTVRELGCGLKPAYLALNPYGRFHLLVSALSPYFLPLELPNAFLGIPPWSDKLYGRAARQVVIRGTSREPYFIDGEIYADHQELVVETGPPIRIPLL